MLSPEIKALLPNEMQDMLDVLKALHGAPEALSLPVVLATANFAAQALANVNPGYTTSIPLSLYTVVLSDTGTFKSTVTNECIRAINEYQADKQSEYQTQMLDYKIEKKKFDKAIEEIVKGDTGGKKKVILKAQSYRVEANRETAKQAAIDKTREKAVLLGFADEDDEQPVRTGDAEHRPKEPEKPVGYIHTVEKATVNGLIDVLSDVGFAGLFTADAGEFFNGYSFSDSGRGAEMVAMLSKLFSGENVNRTTGVRENNVYLKSRRFSMLLLLQQQLAEFLVNATFNEQGFVPRLLVTQPEPFDSPDFDFSTKGEATKREVRMAAEAFHDRMRQLLRSIDVNQAKAVEEARHENPDKLISNKVLILPTLQFDERALLLMQDFGNEMKRAKSEEQYAELGGYIRRCYENACRIAGTLAVFERSDTITLEHAQCAIGLTRYFTEQRVSLVVDGSQGGVVGKHTAIGDILIKWVRNKVNADGAVELTKKYLAQYGPTAFKKADRDTRTKVLEELVERGLLSFDQEVVGPNIKTTFTLA